MTESSLWLSCRHPRADAAIRLYCFPHAGGSASQYLSWARYLPDVEVWGIVPPGRGARLDEPAFTRLPELVAAIVEEVPFRPPYAMFGHSLGALVGYETARAVSAAGRVGPEVLVVSAHRPPHLPHVDEPMHQLPDAEFEAVAAARYPPPPAELAEDPELLGELRATLRADLAVFETYRYLPGPALRCPIVVISGTEDHWNATDLAGWAQHTTAGCTVRLVAGDHFYPEHDPTEAIDVIRQALSSRTGPPGRPPVAPSGGAG